MTQKIVIAGSGFAGFWAAVSAMRAITLAGKHEDIEVLMVSPTPTVTIRPRLYEAVLENMNPDISAQLAAVGVRHLAGTVEGIDAAAKTLTVAQVTGKPLNWFTTAWCGPPAVGCLSRRYRVLPNTGSTSIRWKARSVWMLILKRWRLNRRRRRATPPWWWGRG